MFFNTDDFNIRMQTLENLKKIFLSNELEIYEAGKSDFQKTPEETWLTEIGPVLQELNYALKNLRKWMTPQKVKTNPFNVMHKSFLSYEPIGKVLIIGCWPTPFAYCFIPLINALSAGNTVILKPSEKAPYSSYVIYKIISEAFDLQTVKCIEGEGQEAVKIILSTHRINHVFYTGSGLIGRQIIKQTSENLIPISFSLNNFCPCVVDQDADLKTAARRIISAKFLNAGQYCLAPNYLLVHQRIYFKFRDILIKEIIKMYKPDNNGFVFCGKIIDAEHFQRLKRIIIGKTILFGGQTNELELHIEPTIIEYTSNKDPIFLEEILGPVLPISVFDFMDDVISLFKKHRSCLAYYIFSSSNENIQQWIKRIEGGGYIGINTMGWVATNPELSYVNSGFRGLGEYHGKHGFETFSLKKSIMKTGYFFDRKYLYPPFLNKLKKIKKLMK